MIRQALAGFLLSQSTITSVVGARVRPVVLAQDDTGTSLTYRRLTGGHEPPIDGEDDLPSPRFEFTCWASTYLEAVSLNEALRAVLGNEGHSIENSGEPSTWTTSTGVEVTITAVTYIDEQDVYDANTEGGDKPAFGVQSVYEIQYEET